MEKVIVYKMKWYSDGEFPEFIGIYDEEQDLGSEYHQESVEYFTVKK